MSLRLLEVVVPVAVGPGTRGLLFNQPILGLWQHPLDEEKTAFRVLLYAAQAELVADRLSSQFGRAQGFRILSYRVEATVPEPEAEPRSPAEERAAAPATSSGRISREELYSDVTQGVELSAVYLVSVLLSAVVAAIGLIRSDVAIIIGAMVIAPLLSPTVAMALGATLGDLALARRALGVKAVAVALALGSAAVLGWLLPVTPTSPELLARTEVGVGDLVLALAAGGAGSLAFTSGVPAALIGVMVAVALLPPLVSAGLLWGAGYAAAGSGAMLLYLVNVAAVNLAAIVTFLLQGVRPRGWWDAARAQRASRLAVLSWLLLIALLLALVWLQGGLQEMVKA